MARTLRNTLMSSFYKAHISCGLFATLLVVILITGCQKEQIETYEVPRIKASTEETLGGVKVRMLAAITPNGEQTWFFKLTGPEQEVAKNQADFDRFLASIRFKNEVEKPVSWTLPEGWQEEKGKQLRYATIYPDAKNKALEMTVVALGREAGSLLANINRWRGQIGLGGVSEKELASLTRPTKIGGLESTLVDMRGTSQGGVAKRPPFASGAMGAALPPGHPAARPTIEFAAPQGWTKVPDRTGFRAASFEASEGGRIVEITAIPLGQSAGGLVDNVNRWREQIGLSPVSPEEVNKTVEPMSVGGETGSAVDLLGPETAGQSHQELFAVMLHHQEQSWFFKMKGPADLVERQKPAFATFLKSVRFVEAKE
jgi:hypothetical protein